MLIDRESPKTFDDALQLLKTQLVTQVKDFSQVLEVLNAQLSLQAIYADNSHQQAAENEKERVQKETITRVPMNGMAILLSHPSLKHTGDQVKQAEIERGHLEK